MTLRMPSPHGAQLALLVALTYACGVTGAQQEVPGEDRAQPVIVAPAGQIGHGTYRLFVAYMDAFERSRQHAPHGQLRFQLHLPSDAPMSGVQMRIVGTRTSIDVPIDADASFVMPRDRVAEQENADVRIAPNRRMSWRAIVRSPGVPADMRRLGDLRATCEMRAWRFEPSRASTAHVQDGAPPEHCNGRTFSFEEAHAIAGIRLKYGARDEAISFKSSPENPREYTLELGDASWPDDTLVTFE